MDQSVPCPTGDARRHPATHEQIRPDRRTFLSIAAAVAAGGWPGGVEAKEIAPTPPALRLKPGTPTSVVAQVISPQVINGPVVHQTLIREMLATTLQTVTGTSSVRASWERLLSGVGRLALKFNRSGQYVLGTTPAMAAALIESLLQSGFEPDRVTCLEAPPGVAEPFGCRPPRAGYRTVETDFGSGSDQLLRALDDVEAIINVPFLKDHNIAGITCALKNLSHGLVKHPARYHANGCSPFVADIVALPDIRSRLRLNLVDALRVVYDGGPEATSHNVADIGVILASTDPVAVDSVGVNIINDVRKSRGLPGVVPDASHIPYLRTAHQRGLGVAIAHGIEVRRVGV